MKKSYFLLFLALITTALLNAQNSEVNGSVSGADGLSIPGANVLIQGSSTGTTTDFDGNFSISVKSGDVLIVSYIGFLTQSITISNQTSLTIVLQSDTSELDEVVVVGYGTQRKSNLTGAISKVTNEKLDQIGVARVDDALIGQVSGVNIQATEGEAGSAPTIRIRGVGSINGGLDPLIVVDGMVVDNDYLGSLDINDIASFEILKDAASTAIYGSRGSKGVIMITSKDGKEGKTKFRYNSFTGFKEAHQSDPYYFTTLEHAELERAATGSIQDKTQYKLLLAQAGGDTNWQDIIFDGGAINSQSFSVSGGSKRTKFSSALNYLHDEGVLLTDDYKKYSIKLKVDTKINDNISFGINLSPSVTDRTRFDGSTHDILRQPSWLPLYLDENTIKFVNRTRDKGKYANAKIGDYAVQRMFDDFDLANGVPMPNGASGLDISNTSNTNPAAKVLESDRGDRKFKTYGNAYFKIKFNDNLSLRTSFGGDYQNTSYKRWRGIEHSRKGASAAFLQLSDTNRFHMVTETYFTYNRSIGEHEINSVFGTGAESWNTEFNTAYGAGYTSDLIQTLSGADPLTITAGSMDYKSRLLSFFARVNYTYANKYLASLSVRRDGYSVFGSNQKYGDFPALSVGWKVHQEDFLRDSEVINSLKLRLSYGMTGNPGVDTGNDQVDNYPFLALLATSNAIIDGSAVTGFNSLNISNPNLRWERSIEINPGIDFGLFYNKITGSIDYYERKSDQLLLYNPISSTTGFNNALVNLGEVENKGIELELRSRNVSKENFSWSSTFIASHNKNTLLDFADADGQIQSIDAKRAAEWINQVGQPISSFYGWVVDKEIPTEYLKNPWHPIGAKAQDVYVRDLNGDGLIDDDDKTILGSPYPDLVWSFGNEFKIGDVDLSLLFQGSHGAEVRNMGDQYIFNHFNSGQDFNSSTPNQQFIKQKIFTDAIIQDASYIALRNVNIGYTFSDDSITSQLGISKARVYLSGQNLMYLKADNYTGFNPESINNTSSTTYGYQRAGSPVFKTISLGVNLEF
jgi:TonB-linked SusC/RagA family outer membrane protein|tara:strand:- start:12671 stop:15757 length:3087 start_codon:yes stop_codon:yes gene_type:complete